MVLNITNGQNYTAQIVKFGDDLFPYKDRISKGLCKDYRGFMWVGTPYNGLNRFDGNNFKRFTEESHGLYTNTVNKIIATPDSMLLLHYSDVINQVSNIEIFNPVTHKIYALADYTQQDLPFKTTNKSLRVKKNKDGSIWFYDKHSIWEYQNKSITLYFHLPAPQEISAAYKTPQNSLWVITNKQLLYINSQGKIEEKSLLQNKSDCVGIDDQGALIFAHKSKLYKKAPFSPLATIPYETNKAYIAQLYNPIYNQFWCLSSTDSSTIEVFDTDGHYLQKFPVNQPDKKEEELTPTWWMESIFYWDPEGNLWFHYGDGFAVLQLFSDKFQRYIHDASSTLKAANPIRGIAEDAYGTLYINSFRKYVRKKGDSTFLPLPPNRDPDEAIFADADGTVWTTSFYGLLFEYNPLTGKTILHQYDTFAIKPGLEHQDMYWSIHKDRQNRMWVGQANGLLYLDSLSGNLLPFETTKQLNVVFDFYENEQGLWLLTSSGLYLMDYNYNIIGHFHKKGKGKHYLSHNIIVHLYEDNDGSFWLASKGSGLIHWNPNTGEQNSYKINTEGSDNVIYAVYPDDFNNLWLSSNNGLICFDKSTQEMVIYTKENGITHNEFNTISHYKGKDGMLYFGSLNGVTAFYPKDLVASHTAAPLTLVMVKKFNNTSQKDTDITVDVLQKKQLSILPSDRDTKLRFALLDYNNPKQTEYAYKIEGLDKNWTYLKDPEIHLAGLPYGQYTLLLKAKGSGKKWQKNSLKIEVDVLWPFYFSWWFIALFIGVLALLVNLIIKIRLRISEQQQETLRELVHQKTATILEQTEDLKSLDKMKTNFFVNISHELRTPLTLILGPITRLIEKPNAVNPQEIPQLKLMKRNGNRLLNLIEEILDLSKLDAKKMQLQEKSIHLEEFCRWIFSMFESRASLQKIQFQLDYQVSEGFILKIDKNKTEKILINLLSNAMKFTPADGHVTFQILEQDQQIKFIVKDTGKGIYAKDLSLIFDRFYQSDNNYHQGGTGVGLALSKEFAKLMQGDLYVQSTINKGSTFTFVVPKKAGELVELAFLEKDTLLETESLPPPSSPQPTAKTRILIVEDNPDMQFFIKSLLNDWYDITLAEDGKIAQEYLQKTEQLPQLILSDIMMPRVDGMELLSWLKSEATLAHIPIIMLTAKAEQQNKLQALTIGVDDYLTKPFAPKELLVRVQNLINHAQARTESIEDETATEQEPYPDLNNKDRAWIKKVEQAAQTMIQEKAELTAATLAKASHVSLSTLQRKIKRITGLTVTLYLREIRLQQARNFLESSTYDNIIDISNAAGFRSPYYFGQIYEERFGKKVTDYFVE